MMSRVEPISEVKLTLCVLDDREPIYNEEDFVKIFGDTKVNPFFVVYYTASTYSYSILESLDSPNKRFPGLQALLSSEIEKTQFALPDEDEIELEEDVPPSFSALKIFTQDILDSIKHLFRRSRKIISLRLWCPGNLGVPNSSYISEDAHLLIKNLRPSSVVLISQVVHNPTDVTEMIISSEAAMNQDMLLKMDIDNYLHRRLSRLGYRLPNLVTHGMSVFAGLIEDAIKKEMSDLSVFDNLPPLATASQHSTRGMLAVYILSTYLTGREVDFVTLCSIPRREPFICSIYHPKEDRYEFLYISTFPASLKNITRSRLRSIPVPAGKMSFDHFIQDLQVLVGDAYFHSNKLRLCIEATLGDDESCSITAKTNNLIQRIRPDCLHIITKEHNEEYCNLFLRRQHTQHNYVLPKKKMDGNCVPLSMLYKYLPEKLENGTEAGEIKTDIVYATNGPNDLMIENEHKGGFFHGILKKSAIKIIPSQETFSSIETIEELSFDSRDSVFEIQQCLNTNIIPCIALERNTPEQRILSPRLPVDVSESNKTFAMFKSRPAAHTPTKIRFRDQCGLRRMISPPTLEEQATYGWSYYIVTHESFFYYSNLKKTVEEIEFETEESAFSVIQWVHQAFQNDVEKLSEQELELITTYSKHSHHAILGSCKSIDEYDSDLCCKCVIQ